MLNYALIIIHVSGCCCFTDLTFVRWDILFAINLPLSLLVKDFENPSAFDKFRGKNIEAPFPRHGVD